MRTLLACALTVFVAASASAILPAREAYLPAVAHAPGQCVGSPPVCAAWRTTAWIFNPSTAETASVRVELLRRDADNSNPMAQNVALAPGETRELEDVVLSLFGADSTAGALRFVADRPVVVTGRIYDANVVTSKGSGTAGQFFAASAASDAIGLGESANLVGLAQDADGVWRSNFGVVETTGATCTISVERLDASGTSLGSAATFNVGSRSQRQFSIADIPGSAGTNQRLRVTVTAGTGKVLPFASRIDNRTGDPSTVEMAGRGRDGTWVGKLDKTGYDTPITLTVAGNAVTALDATVLFTDEDVPTCQGGELLRLAGALQQPVAIDDSGAFSFVLSSTVGGVGVSLQVNGVLTPEGGLGGTATTTLSGAGTCSGSKTWALVGGRVL